MSSLRTHRDQRNHGRLLPQMAAKNRGGRFDTGLGFHGGVGQKLRGR